MRFASVRRITLLFFLSVLVIFALPAQQSDQARGLDVIGFGYDVFGTYADMSSVMQYQLFDLGPVRAQPIGAYTFQVPEAVSLQNISRHNVTTVEGEDLRSYSQKMSAEVGLSADAMFFSASISTSFNTGTQKSSRNYFYTYRDANIKWRVSLDTRSIASLKRHLRPEARRDINTMDPKRLFDYYGAYYIASAYLGGRAELNVTIRQTEKTSMKEIGVAVEAKYNAISGNTRTSTSKSNSASSVLSNSKLTVVGGKSEYANNIRDPEQYRMWASGINDWPILCDFERGSLRPIWELADSAARTAELKQAFEEIKREHPLPAAFVDILGMEKQVFMIQNLGTGLYWDMPGYNNAARDTAGEDIVLYDADALAARPEGIDRVVKVVSNKYEPEWVALQPQNTELVAAVNDQEGTIELGKANFRDRHIQFKMEAVDFQDDVYYLISRRNGLALTAEKQGNNSRIVLQRLDPKNLNQHWYFRTLQAEDIAQPDGAQYIISCAAGGNYWDLPGVYPSVRSGEVQLWPKENFMSADRVVSIEPFDNGNFRLMRPMSQNSALLTAKSQTRLSVQKRTENPDQQWRFVYAGSPNTYYIKSRGIAGEAIDANAGKANQNGCDVNLWPFHGADNQKWVLKKVPKLDDKHLIYRGKYQIRTAKKNLILEIKGKWNEDNRNGANIDVWDIHYDPDTMVKFLPQPDGTFIIQFQNGGRVLDVSGGHSDKGTNIHIWDNLNKPWQKWFLEPVGDGMYRLRNAKTDKVADIKTGSDFGRGDNVHQWRPHSGISQRWKIFYADGPLKGRQAY